MTDNIHDPSAAKQFAQQQYATPGNLNARKTLHALFSTNPRGWYSWYMDQLDLPASARILELGCGPADLWRANLPRLSAGWRLTLTDFSAGMVGSARENLFSPPAPSSGQFTFAIVDAQSIPFPDSSFDAIIANHMIYHIPDRAQGIREMRRVLRPGGTLYAATNGERHMVDLDALVARLAPDLMPQVIPVSPSFASCFTLENGPEQLSQAFEHMQMRRYQDGLVVTEAQPLVDYVLSMTRYTNRLVPAEIVQAFKSAIEREIQAHGAIPIAKDTGLIIAG